MHKLKKKKNEKILTNYDMNDALPRIPTPLTTYQPQHTEIEQKDIMDFRSMYQQPKVTVNSNSYTSFPPSFLLLSTFFFMLKKKIIYVEKSI